jgi:hypothetical protein
MEATMTHPRKSKLALAIKIYLDVTWWICLIAIVPLVLILLFFLFAQIEEPVEMRVLARFQLTGSALAAAPAAGPAETGQVRGQGLLRIPQVDKTALVLQFLGAIVVLAVVLYVLRHLRALLRSVREGRPFDPRNARRIRDVGLAVVGCNLLAPIAKYAVGKVVLDGVRLPGVVLKPPLDFQPDGLFLGLAILVLAEVFHRASLLQQDQNLTV